MIGRWLGEWVGAWFGSSEPAPEGSIQGTATIRISSSGVIDGSSEPVIVGIHGVASVSLTASGRLKVEDATGGIMATIARLRRQFSEKRTAAIQAKQAEALAQQEAQKAEDDRRSTETEEKHLAEMVAQGAEMRRRELERNSNVLEFKPVIDSGSIVSRAEVVASRVRPSVPVRDASTETATLSDNDDLALILLLLEAA